MTAVTAEQRRDGFEAAFNSAGTHTRQLRPSPTIWWPAVS